MQEMILPPNAPRVLSHFDLVNEYNGALYTAPLIRDLPKPPMPEGMAYLPQYQGLPIGFMFQVNDGVPNFKELDPDRVKKCANLCLCGLCGRPLRSDKWFVVVGGPLTMINKVCTDPPFHPDCARYALGVCPYLLGRTEYSKETQAKEKAGELAPWSMSQHSPPMIAFLYGVGYKSELRAKPDDPNLVFHLFALAPWVKVEWFRRIPAKEAGPMFHLS